ncbi:MBL fold metallo-hydrolase [Phaeobacter sp. C3_T13_0]|uniref:MBL fold metallo-hydrolase n=1 Tax=Phaeobacter cretensis TaxID=3342641 RepID=UPI0039BD5171
MKLCFIGMATVVFEIGGSRFITDPVLDPAGTGYTLGSTGAVRYVNEVGPATAVTDIGPVDYALVSHDHHKDNLDRSGRDFLKTATKTFTTTAGAQRLVQRHGIDAVGMQPWDQRELTLRDGTVLRITATPARHGPPVVAKLLAGPVIGFLLEWDGFQDGAVYLTGDTRLFEGVRQVARDFDVGTVFMNLRAGSFGLTGSVCYSMPATEGAKTAELFPKARIIPLHYDGWSHLSENRSDVLKAFDVPHLNQRLHWLPKGLEVSLEV